MENRTEGWFISHCEDDYCDLGSFNYECPTCNKISTDYDVWWEQFNIHNDTLIDFKCKKCKVELQVGWDDEEIEYYVKNK